MTSEAMARLISDSGLAATELTPFAASTAIGDAATLKNRIASLEQVPALSEFAHAATAAIQSDTTPSHAEYVARSLENLQAAATALLRHLHRSDSLQTIGSGHAVWVTFPTQLPLSEFSSNIARVSQIITAVLALEQNRRHVTVEAADLGPFSLRIGFESGFAFDLIASVIGAAKGSMQRMSESSASAERKRNQDGFAKSLVFAEAAAVLAGAPRIARDNETAEAICHAIIGLIDLFALGIEMRPLLNTETGGKR